VVKPPANIDSVCHVNKSASFGSKVYMNSSFVEYLKNIGEKVSTTHKQVKVSVSALYKDFYKYGGVRVDFPDDLVCLASSFFVQEFGPVLDGCKVQSFDWAREQMDLSTSPGLPYSKVVHSKQRLSDDQWEDIRQKVDHWDVQQHVPLFTVTTKREMRTNEKVDSDTNRSICASPIELTMLGHKLFGEMDNRMLESSVDTCFMPGDSKYGGGWDRLARFMGCNDPLFSAGMVEGDFKQFDSGMTAFMLFIIMNLRMSFMSCLTVFDVKSFWYYYWNIVHSYCVMDDGNVLQKHNGNPSGQKGTTGDNCICNYLYISCWWIDSVRKAGMMPSYAFFRASIKKKFYGDDLMLAVVFALRGVCTPESLIHFFASVGITIKIPSETFVTIEQMHFLSAGFKKDRGMYVPIVDESKMLSALMLGEAVDDPRMQYARACAIRVEMFYTPRRALVDGYIRFLEARYGAFLSSGNVGKASGQALHSQYQTDAVIDDLYRARETGCKTSYRFKADDLICLSCS